MITSSRSLCIILSMRRIHAYWVALATHLI
jgi:hypothetical protein